MEVLRFFQSPGLSVGKLKDKLGDFKERLKKVRILNIETEYCYYVEISRKLNSDEIKHLKWILAPAVEGKLETSTQLKHTDTSVIIEIGPRLNFSTAFSTNAVSIANSINLPISRVERSTRYIVALSDQCTADTENDIVNHLHDRMTECRYVVPITSFNVEVNSKDWTEVDLLGRGRKALEEVSSELGLAFDDWDLDYYTKLFCEKLKRNPTTVECFDLAQSNSEHSRHWFFKGRMVINGTEMQDTLFDMIIRTQDFSNGNNVIKFSDNSSAIKGYSVPTFVPETSLLPSRFRALPGVRHIIFTAETHNFPTGVAPFSGATTGTGGRIRDVHAAGRGAHVIAGSAAYSFGNLNIPGYSLPWEDDSFEYPPNFASSLSVAVEASNGASDYGNKFGEPIILGFARSFGMLLPNGERQEFIKPIMFTGGIGSIDDSMTAKYPPEKEMLVVKIGGPVYRIGVGGGAASSVHVQGDQKAELDFGAVQRGDAEMEQKLNRVIRSCIELGDGNIICSIHDQGAGGNGNVLKEIVEPEGAVILASEFQLGDPTINTLELWGAEYQESDAILIRPQHKSLLQTISEREKCPASFVGVVTGDGKIVLKENKVESSEKRNPVDLELSHVLGKMPRKTFMLEKHTPVLKPLVLPADLNLQLALDRVLRLPSVASKRYLTNKVDRSVTGLIAQQQCVGPLHTPLADVAVVALSYFMSCGGATSIGEQPIKGLLSPAAGARLSVAEALTNLVFAKVSSLGDVKCSGNWMWAAKLPGEGAALYEACKAMCDVMCQLGIAIDGGKDSLSMAARVGKSTVKSPGTLVISAYVNCPDVNLTVTPDLKLPDGKGALLYVDLGNGKKRLGGSAFAQCFKQLGDDVPDLENPDLLREAFNIIQELLSKKMLSAGHDISDGGFVTCLLEMAFAGNCGVNVTVPSESSVFSAMFNEEIGWILEVSEKDVPSVVDCFQNKGINCSHIGYSEGFGPSATITLKFKGEVVLKERTATLRDTWEETSFQLEMFQTDHDCVLEEKSSLSSRTAPPYSVSFDASLLKLHYTLNTNGPCVAVIREEGINGDREMCASFFLAGFQVWDVTMTDLLSKRISLDRFQGIIFPGGFSYADVLGSARGWAAGLLFHSDLEAQFTVFKNRPNTFSLGVCNGCQLMALLGWIAPYSDDQGKPTHGVVLAHNVSERFESRFVSVKITDSPAIMLKDMADSVLGVWVAHGEGRFVFKNEEILSEVKSKKLAPLLYVNDNGQPTTEYPYNPNGTVSGIASVCSSDGRHLAMMPHPERCVMPWQWAWMPQQLSTTMTVSPWMKMFINAYEWCCSNQ